MKSTILSQYLSLAKVKHTKLASAKFFNEHPHKYNLFGLSKMLEYYNIANAGLQLNMTDLYKFETPFIAHLGDDFVVVNKLDDTISYIWKGKEMETSVEEFNSAWSGIILYSEPDEDSIEPSYKTNKIKEIFNLTQKYLLLALIGALLLIAYIHNGLYQSFGYSLALVVNLVGIYIGFLLEQKQLNIQSDYADKICSLLKQSDCNNILESDAAKLWGVIGWSEVGLSYFISNTIIILLFPQIYPYLALINIFALPYSFWSVWYQKFKAKQWCPLCLIVQALLWSVFIVNIIFGYISMPTFTLENIFIVACLYAIPFLLINLFIPKLSEGNKIEEIKQEINSLKADEDVFLTILKKQRYHEISINNSKIIIGNPNSSLRITILTNPHCEPCAKMHKRIHELLEINPNICVQYIFSSFYPELNSSGKFLIATYFNKSEEERNNIYDEWFASGKNDKEKFFNTYKQDIDTEMVLNEFERHNAWQEITKLKATPTVLVNGYVLPGNYKIEDLKYFSDIDFNAK